MSADTTSSLANWVISTALNAGVLINYFERPGLKATCTNLGDGSGSGSLTFQQPTYNPGTDAFAAHGSEAGSVTPDSLADGSFNTTVAAQVLDHQLSDEALFQIDGASWGNFIEQRAPWFADQADNRISQMICDLMDDFTDITGTAGDSLTVDDLLTARAFMATLGGNGMAYAVVHPHQYSQLYNSMRAESLDGIFHPSVASIGKFGSVKGVVCSDILLIETAMVGTVSSNHRGAMYRSDAFGYKHGIPKGLGSWAPGARVMGVSAGDIQAWLASNGMASPDPAYLDKMVGLMQAQVQPAIYIETGRQGNFSTRQAVLGATLFVGVGQDVTRGTSLRSTTS